MEEQYKFISKKIFEKNKINVDYRFKLIYAIAMISVIADHLFGKGSIELNIHGWFNYSSYHMPLFMFSAGYFFKSRNINHTSEYIYKKFTKLIFPIYTYNFFYGIYFQVLKKLGFRSNYIRSFSFGIIFIEPLGGRGFHYIKPSWFSSSLFFVEVYNILKRKLTSFFGIEFHESIYLIIDFIISYNSINLSNRGFNKKIIHIHILRFLHLNIYYEFGIFFNKHLENIIKSIKSDTFFTTIFLLKLLFHLYYSKAPTFYYGLSIYYNYPPITVITISILGIFFWVRLSEILEPILGENYYVNIIADNTFSIMINHFLAFEIVKTIFAFISKYSNHCKDFDFNLYYSLSVSYIYIPNNVLQSGIIYILSGLFIPIMIQKNIDIVKKKFFKIIISNKIKQK